MKERPLLMTPENAQKVFDGVKTQTRRIIMPQPEDVGYRKNCLVQPFCPGTEWPLAYSEKRGSHWSKSEPLVCPYGFVGGQCWIQEPHYLFGHWERSLTKVSGRSTWRFLCKRSHGVRFPDNPPAEVKKTRTERGWFRRHGMHMPRWACRTVVELTEIKVGGVQDITPDDIQAEGVDCNRLDGGFDDGVAFGNFILLWDSINGPGAWQRNPWVWALTMRRMKPSETTTKEHA